jgi:hypothetical protein
MSSRIETDVFWLRYRRLMMVVYILCLQPEFGVLPEKLVFPLRGVVFLVAAERIEPGRKCSLRKLPRLPPRKNKDCASSAVQHKNFSF